MGDFSVLLVVTSTKMAFLFGGFVITREAFEGGVQPDADAPRFVRIRNELKKGREGRVSPEDYQWFLETRSRQRRLRYNTIIDKFERMGSHEFGEIDPVTLASLQELDGDKFHHMLVCDRCNRAFQQGDFFQQTRTGEGREAERIWRHVNCDRPQVDPHSVEALQGLPRHSLFSNIS